MGYWILILMNLVNHLLLFNAVSISQCVDINKDLFAQVFLDEVDDGGDCGIVLRRWSAT